MDGTRSVEDHTTAAPSAMAQHRAIAVATDDDDQDRLGVQDLGWIAGLKPHRLTGRAGNHTTAKYNNATGCERPAPPHRRAGNVAHPRPGGAPQCPAHGGERFRTTS